MESTMVIKVKYGETLRRFNAHIYENELYLDMGGLREKVLSLFNFAPDADLTFTYVDEDGDVVALVDEEDLRDVIRQSLNPLRITVKFNTEKDGRSYFRSSESSTPRSSPQVQHPLSNLNTGVAELLKPVPEPFREALSKVSLDVSSKAVSSAPGLAELVECFSKMGQSYINSILESQTAAGLSTQSGASASTVDASIGKDHKASKDGGATIEVLPNMNFEATNSEKNEYTEVRNASIGVATSVSPGPSSVNSIGLPGDSVMSGLSSRNSVPVSFHEALENEEVTEKSSDLHNGMHTFNECPFSGMVLIKNDQTANHVQYGGPLTPFKRSYNHNDGLGSVFHGGIRCDGCGIHPIAGPRFKSKVKMDYDLCSICFSEMGNESDYIRMDRPVSNRHRWSSSGLYDPIQQIPTHPPKLPVVLRNYGMKSKGPKLDSCFILDVNVPDGSVMAPSTPFTKVWQMRNNGSVTWPQGTQLVWIGGHKLSEKLAVEISGGDLPVDYETCIAVDFTTPELSGRYISYWRMASPTGQKFGQQIWVDIQVDAALKDTLCFSLQYLDLNLPHDDDGKTGAEVINASVEPSVHDNPLEPLRTATEPIKPIVEELQNKDSKLNFPINDTLLVGPSKASSSVSYPIIDLNEAAPTVPFHAPCPVTNGPITESVQEVGEGNNVEQTLLRQLEEMGFNQVNLNKEILRMNEYDLERSVDDLCGAAEWDPILEELREMGFCDKETNQRLLKKNNGSIKRVVMDLLAGV